jgi:hypothetical protein
VTEEDIALVLDLGCQGRIALGISYENGRRALEEWLWHLAEALEIELTPMTRPH